MVKGFNKVFGGATGQDKLDATGGIKPSETFVMGKSAAMFMSGAEVRAKASGPAANKPQR